MSNICCGKCSIRIKRKLSFQSFFRWKSTQLWGSLTHFTTCSASPLGTESRVPFQKGSVMETRLCSIFAIQASRSLTQNQMNQALFAGWLDTPFLAAFLPLSDPISVENKKFANRTPVTAIHFPILKFEHQTLDNINGVWFQKILVFKVTLLSL